MLKITAHFVMCCLACLCLMTAAVAQEADMPPEATAQLERVLHDVRQKGIAQSVRLVVRYSGEATVQGRPCYSMTVYADGPERYENVGTYAVSRDGKTLYKYDVVEDSYTRIQDSPKK
ncbi:MAG: hypothetical protein PHI96_01740 [Desulfovibrio sp.]|nr:hypothetical protein [Desulfovibrio sp.]